MLIKFNNEVLAPEIFNSTDQQPVKNKADPEKGNENSEDLSEDSEEEEQNVQEDQIEEESEESDDSDESEDEDEKKSGEKEGEENHESKAKQVEVKEEPADEEDETTKMPEGAWQQYYDPLKVSSLCMVKWYHQMTNPDPQREPEYANAGKTCAWELIELQNHFHPSVSKVYHTASFQDPLRVNTSVLSGLQCFLRVHQ